MSTQSEQRTHTTLWVRKDTAERLDNLKPFDSLTWDEFLVELADTYENRE
jgi:hypothetical protein